MDDSDEPMIKENLIGSPSPKAKRNMIKVEEEEEERPEENVYVAKFKALNVVQIGNAMKQMKFSVGTKRFLIQGIMLRVLENLHMMDDEWTMKIEITDETCPKPIVCILTHDLLCQLMGMTPSQAIVC